MTADIELRKHIRSRFLRTAYTGLLGNMVAAFIWSVGLASPSIGATRLRWWLALMAVACISMAVAAGVPSISRFATRHGVPRLSIIGLALAGSLWGISPWMHPDAAGDLAFAYGTGAILLGISSASMVASSGSLATTAPMLIPIFVGLTGAAFTMGLIGAARIDPLTGLLNRRGFENTVTHRSTTDPSWEQIQLIFIDLDRFKHVNDSLGHDAGDHLIAAVAQRLTRTCGDAVIGRLGGDEFVVIVPGTTQSSALSIASAVQAMFEQPFRLSGAAVTAVSMTASIGLSRPGNAAQLYRLLDEADRAMFTAKHHGGDLIRQVESVPATFREHMLEAPDALPIELASDVVLDLAAGASGHGVNDTNGSGIELSL